MLIRLSHEISHSWFGLVIGALDWTEEWLSEGFATFAEDYIHQRAMEILSEKISSAEEQSSPENQYTQVQNFPSSSTLFTTL
jgi:aminopeptidase N